MEKMMKGWLAKAKHIGDGTSGGPPGPSGQRRGSIFNRNPAPALSAERPSIQQQELEEDPLAAAEKSAAARAAELAKQRAASTAWSNEQRMEREVHLQQMWRRHMRGAAGLDAEMKAVQRSWWAHAWRFFVARNSTLGGASSTV